jgi:two-component system OmpR family response regulator
MAGSRVLLVEDNPSIRRLLLGSLSSMAKVEACASADEAVSRAASFEPELIIADYRMPSTDGLQLIVQLRSQFPQIGTILLASREDINKLLAGSSAIVEEFIEKPFFLDEAMLRIKRVLDRVTLMRQQQTAPESTSVRGTLAQMSVTDLLQTLDIGRKSCRLTITGHDEACEMYFQEGQIIHAALGALTGEPAVYQAVWWTEGGFTIDFGIENCPQTITHSTQSVLMEALRLFDEANRDTPKRPAEAHRNPAFGGLAAAHF